MLPLPVPASVYGLVLMLAALCTGILKLEQIKETAGFLIEIMPVIMAAGAFVQGASIELSADAPMREPYTVYLQGGLTYESGKVGILLAAEELLRGES